MDTKEQVSYQTTKMQREIILTKLKEKGCRITKQRLRLIDIILQNECSSCKEIFYRALEEDDKLGVATVYRMVNLLEEIGAISRKNMYKVAYSENCMMENACTIELDDGSIHHLSAKKWNSVIRKMIFNKISPIRIMIRIAARFIPQSIILSTEKKSFHDPLVNAS